ncbi:MAG: putative oxidoreductase [Blastocatellia bacterium]|nr:putative oxidoreductase [Blastocatellia bacterium]
MANLDSIKATWAPRLLSVLRIIAAFLLMQHGAQKLFGVLVPPPEPGAPAPPAFTLLSPAGVAGILEFFGGLLILLGLFTRPVAFLLSGLLAVGYFMVHAPMGFWPILNKGELAVIYCFVFLYLSAAGAGVWSLDYLWRRNADASYGASRDER